ncbi:hypothetical protein ACH9EU_11265 [Kocuria sp. M1R5S2]|uniref:hypothetical protein n=1 Tax=Kocuria rhizosphaerae TaxID=3376285 RepID=UPI0037B2292C
MTGSSAGQPGPDEGTRAGTVPSTGHERVDAVLARAAELDTAEVAEHPRLHEELHAALAAELDAEPGTVPPGPVPRTDPDRP